MDILNHVSQTTLCSGVVSHLLLTLIIIFIICLKLKLCFRNPKLADIIPLLVDDLFPFLFCTMYVKRSSLHSQILSVLSLLKIYINFVRNFKELNNKRFSSYLLKEGKSKNLMLNSSRLL